MSVANLLGLPNARDAISMLPSSTMDAADNVGCKNWLLQVATNDDLRRVACELSHRPRRFLIDWLDDVRFFCISSNTSLTLVAGPVIKRSYSRRTLLVPVVRGYGSKLGGFPYPAVGLNRWSYHTTHTPLLWRRPWLMRNFFGWRTLYHLRAFTQRILGLGMGSAPSMP